MLVEFRVKRHTDIYPIKWEDRTPEYKGEFRDIQEAGHHAITKMLGSINDEALVIREIRYNSKGSLQGHCLAGSSRVAWQFRKAGMI